MSFNRKLVRFLGVKDCVHNHRLITPSIVAATLSLIMWLIAAVLIPSGIILTIFGGLFMFIFGFLLYFGLSQV